MIWNHALVVEVAGVIDASTTSVFDSYATDFTSKHLSRDRAHDLALEHVCWRLNRRTYRPPLMNSDFLFQIRSWVRGYLGQLLVQETQPDVVSQALESLNRSSYRRDQLMSLGLVLRELDCTTRTSAKQVAMVS